MARINRTAINTVAAPEPFTPDRTSDRDRNLKRLQFQWSRVAGITASDFTLLARIAPDLPWTPVISANTTAQGLQEVPPYPEYAVALTALTGAGTFTFDLEYPD